MRVDVSPYTLWELLDDDDATSEPSLILSVIGVAHGNLWWATDVDTLAQVLANPQSSNGLRQSPLYGRMSGALDQLTDGDSSFRFYARAGNDLMPPFSFIPIETGWPGEGDDVWSAFLRPLLQSASPAVAGGGVTGPSALDVRTDSDGWTLTGFSMRESGR